MNRERTGKTLLLTLACCMAVTPLAGGPKNSKTLPPADAKQQVLNLEREWVDAEIKHDAATLRRILDDKFLASFGPNKPYDKETLVQRMTSSDVDPTESQTQKRDHRPRHGSCGWYRHFARDKERRWVYGGRYTATYIHRHGQWLALAEHLVEVPQAK